MTQYKVTFTDDEWAEILKDFGHLINDLPEHARTDSNIIRAIRGLPPLVRGCERPAVFEAGNQHSPRAKKRKRSKK